MMVHQRELTLPAVPRGFHLITDPVVRAVPEIRELAVGIAHVFIKHTSASLTLNENADPTVRADFETHFDLAVPEGAPYYRHDTEGPDDMPAHIKSSLLGSALSIPITGGRLNLGTWQGIYLCEHRDHAGPRASSSRCSASEEVPAADAPTCARGSSIEAEGAQEG